VNGVATPESPVIVTAAQNHDIDERCGRSRYEGQGVRLKQASTEFAHERLNELPDRHARRNGVRVDDDVRSDALNRGETDQQRVRLESGSSSGSLPKGHRINEGVRIRRLQQRNVRKEEEDRPRSSTACPPGGRSCQSCPSARAATRICRRSAGCAPSACALS
jgi:hypothetical protein